MAAFIGGVYFYSIQAVKQEDFVSPSSYTHSIDRPYMVSSEDVTNTSSTSPRQGDVEDLLPPASQRATMKTIEEELAEKRASMPQTHALPTESNTSRPSDAMPPLIGSVHPNPALGPGSLETVLPLPTPPSASADLNARTPSSSPFKVYVNDTPTGADINRGTAAGYSSEEQFAMFRLPFFKGKAYKAGVDVDNIGTTRDRWA